jgi:radical SAM protein with 4Fe4S-binding SPASM domain
MRNDNLPQGRRGDIAPSFLFRPQIPYHIVWLATNACNARCVHCSSDAAKKLPGELTTDEAKSVFNDLADFGVFDVAVSGGEPLTRSDIFEVMEHAAGLGIRLGLGSNGSTVTPSKVDKLLKLGLDRLQISLDGLESTHNTARRWNGLFQKSVNAIKLGLNAGLRVHVCFTAHRLNFKEIGSVIDFCSELGVRRFNFSRLVPTGRADTILDLLPGEWKETIAVFNAKRKEYADQMDFTTHLAQQILSDPSLEDHLGFSGCQAGVGQGCIDSVGNVTPCVMLPVIIGNIRERSFADIWRSSETIKALRDRSQLKGWCRSCTHRDKCGGCRGVAYGYTGDPLAEDPRCWLFAPLDQKPQCVPASMRSQFKLIG